MNNGRTLAGDEASIDEIGGRLCDILGLAGPVCDVAGDIVVGILDRVAVFVALTTLVQGLYPAGTDAVDADAPPAGADGHAGGQAALAGLAGGVAFLVRIADLGAEAVDVDDAGPCTLCAGRVGGLPGLVAAAARGGRGGADVGDAHQRDAGLRHGEGGGQVGVEVGTPL